MPNTEKSKTKRVRNAGGKDGGRDARPTDATAEHGQDAHAAKRHGLEARATKERRGPEARGTEAPALPSIRAVAAEAKVSLAAVSRVMNKSAPVSAEKKKRVLAAAKKLGYTTNAAARAMRRGPIDSIGWLISPSVAETEDEGWIADAAVPLFTACSSNGMSLIPEQLKADSKGGLLRPETIRAGRIGSAIVMGELTGRAMEQMQKWNIPMCFWEIAYPIDSAHFLNVLSDASLGTRQTVNHLYKLGHHRIGFVHGTLQSNLPRIETFKQMIGELDLDKDKKLIVQVKEDEQNYSGGLCATRKLLALDNPPTAICLATNWYAIGALTAAAERNIEVPKKLSIAALTDGYLSHQAKPALTSVKKDMFAMAETAVKMLKRRVNGKEVKQNTIVHNPQLVVRESTGRNGRLDAK